MKTYIIDIYRDGSQWTGFDSAVSLDAAKAQVLAKYPAATEVIPGDGYRQEDAAAKSSSGEADHVARFELDSTDYADIYEIAE